MHWYRIAQTNVQIAGWNNEGDLFVYINGKRYVYVNVPANVRGKLENFIKYQNWSQVFKILRNLEQIEPPPKQTEPKLFD